jgi:Protein of unknown function (DUF3501)
VTGPDAGPAIAGPAAQPPGAPTLLTLDDILEQRAYERVRPEYRRAVIERKRYRRVALGPHMTVVFESADTVRFQIQEMARAERIATDEGIQEELDAYNPLLPQPGELSATLFIELTTEAQLREVLPALVGIETALAIEVGADGAAGGRHLVVSVPEANHAQALTRDTVTPAVHYLRFGFEPTLIEALAVGPAALLARHPAYEARTVLDGETREELVGDLRGTTVPLPLA